MNAAATTAAQVLAQGLVDLGVTLAFGVSGGGIAAAWSALGQHPALTLIHTQHESGAAFAATEASLASGRPVVVAVTTGPGLTNALTGLVAARQEGASVIALVGVTPAGRRGLGATQETDAGGPLPDALRPGAIAHLALTVESADGLGPALRRAAQALSRPGGAVVVLGLPTDVLGALALPVHAAPVNRAPLDADPALLDRVAAALLTGDVTVLVGRGARGADLAALADRCPARFVVAPDAKGILPDEHPRNLGVVGLAGRDTTLAGLHPASELLLTLGARLGEAETGWTAALHAARVISVVADPDGLVGSYADLPQTIVEADPRRFVAGLLARLPATSTCPPGPPRARRAPPAPRSGPVHPAALLHAVQRAVVDDSDAVVLAESGASFAWAIHLLELSTPRLRVSVGWGAMGHATTGAIGVAATGRRAVALVGDGALLMGNELVTAARRNLPVVWVVLDDGGYGLCRHGMRALRLPATELDQPSVDFAALATALGLLGLRADTEDAVEPALRAALAHPGPALVAVRVDPSAPPPMGRRIAALTFHQAELP
jgi:acetolactate synthase-1/2/3 large subunit